jgi:hypothetical protein
MELVQEIREGIGEIGLALRRPEELVVRWRDRGGRFGDAPRPSIFPILVVNAALGLAAYGLTLGMHLGAATMLLDSAKAPLAAGAAWTLALPALYIIHAAFGSKLDPSTMILAALATVSFGALALLASVPVNWFFTLALPFNSVRIAVNATIFLGVGVCMVDVFLRTLRAVEPEGGRLYPTLWLGLVGLISVELFLLLKVIDPAWL